MRKAPICVPKAIKRCFQLKYKIDKSYKLVKTFPKYFFMGRCIDQNRKKL